MPKVYAHSHKLRARKPKKTMSEMRIALIEFDPNYLDYDRSEKLTVVHRARRMGILPSRKSNNNTWQAEANRARKGKIKLVRKNGYRNKTWRGRPTRWFGEQENYEMPKIIKPSRIKSINLELEVM